MFRRTLSLAFFAWAVAASPSAAWAWGSDLSLPPPAPVVDEFRLLEGGEGARLEQLVKQIKQRSGMEISIFIPSSLRGRQIEDFSIAVAEEWKLGRKKEDKGLLFVFAPKERKMRIEVGYGLEGELTDAFTRRVLDNGVRPLFKQGRYYEGILTALQLIQEKVPLGLEAQDLPSGGRVSIPITVLFIFFFAFMIIAGVLNNFLPRSSYRRRGPFGGGWGAGSSWGGGGWSGGSGGSSWGGGGGGFGGGGSSSDW